MGVVAIFGPTAVGKTAIAIELAALLRDAGREPVAISADSIQIYRGLEVLSGAPSEEEQRLLPHHLVGIAEAEEEFSAGRFARLARELIDDAIARDAVPIVVGGTGLYMRAALAELELRPPVPGELRAAVEDELRTRGPEALHAELPGDVAARIEPRDRKRIARSTELLRLGLDPPERSTELWTAQLRQPTRMFGIAGDRDWLAARIDRRVDAMFAAGAGEEARRISSVASRTARAALGFEAIQEGDLEAVKVAHRRYGRRQMTWMRNMEGVEVIDRTEMDETAVAERIFTRID